MRGPDTTVASIEGIDLHLPDELALLVGYRSWRRTRAVATDSFNRNNHGRRGAVWHHHLAVQNDLVYIRASRSSEREKCNCQARAKENGLRDHGASSIEIRRLEQRVMPGAQPDVGSRLDPPSA